MEARKAVQCECCYSLNGKFRADLCEKITFKDLKEVRNQHIVMSGKEWPKGWKQ